jgi:hypothetical protein
MFILFNDDGESCYYDAIPVPGTEEWLNHMREEERVQAR